MMDCVCDAYGMCPQGCKHCGVCSGEFGTEEIVMRAIQRLDYHMQPVLNWEPGKPGMMVRCICGRKVRVVYGQLERHFDGQALCPGSYVPPEEIPGR